MARRLVWFLSVVTLLMADTGRILAQMVPEHPFRAWGVVPVVFAVILGAPILQRVRPLAFEAVWFRPLSWFSSWFLGLWATFLMLTLVGDGFHGLSWIRTRLLGGGSSGSVGGSQHELWILLGASLVMTLLGAIEVVRGPRLKDVSVVLPDLPKDLEGFTIVQISDLHVGPTIRKSYVKRVVELANRAAPDLITLTGDIGDGSARSLQPHLDPLGHLQSRFGAFFVTGNHEYYWDVEGFCKSLEALKITPLLNTNRLFRMNGGSEVLLAGVPDPAGAEMGHAPPPNVVLAAQTSGHPAVKILMSHRPGLFADAERAGFDLQLSGHTHSGQFFPFSMVVRFAHKYYRGLNRIGRLWLYVNPGTGYWGPANRFTITAEITVLRLQANGGAR